MTAPTLTARDTTLLGAVVAGCAESTGETPLPWEVLELIGDLVPSDQLCFSGQDSSAAAVYLGQTIEGDDRALELPVAPKAGDDAYWLHYWQSVCSHPERTGDFTHVTLLSDFCSQREWRAHPMRVDYLTDVQWEMMLALDDGGRRTARLLFFRTSGSDFAERERFLLTLLRPHVEQAYRLWQRARREAVTITPRQRELVELIGEGLSNRQIARRLGLSEATVRTHLANVYDRLGVNSRTAAVMQVLDVRATLPEQRRRLTTSDVA